MPLTEKEYNAFKNAERRYQEQVWSHADKPGATTDDPGYASAVQGLSKLGSLIDNYESSTRVTDETGKLTGEPKTRLPAKVQGDEKDTSGWNYHFEPSVAEVQKLLKTQPELLDRLGIKKDWLSTGATPSLSLPMNVDIPGGINGPTGMLTQAPSTYLDKINEHSTPYKEVAKHLWKQRSEQAVAKGENVQRYQDIPLNGQPVDYLGGGSQYLVERRLAPLAMGVADSASMGMAAPLYDAARDLADYELSKRGVDTEFLPPSSEDVINRSPGMHMAGQFAGYGLKGNPANIVQEGLAAGGKKLLSKLPRPPTGLDAVAPNALVAAGAGAGANVAEGEFGELARNVGKPVPMPMHKALGRVGENAGMNALSGAVLGGGFDVAAQVAGGVRSNFREGEHLRGLKTLEDAGGSTDVFRGVVRPPATEKFFSAANERRAKGSPGALASEDLAGALDESIAGQTREQQKRIAAQAEEYYNHPSYNQRTVSSRPMVEALLDVAGRGRTIGPVTESAINMRPKILKDVRDEFSKGWAQLTFVHQSEAAEFIAAKDGVVIDAQLAQDLFGRGEEASRDVVPVIVPKPMTPYLVTQLEKEIDDKLAFAKNTEVDDPVYTELNRVTKLQRDEFPYYVDESGQLVPPPESNRNSEGPFGPSGDLPPQDEGSLSVLPPPIPIEGQPGRPEGFLGVGPGQPELPGTFDKRAPADPGSPLEAMAAPIDIRGSSLDPTPRPEGLLGVGPGQPSLPQNPFDPRLPTSRELLSPQQTVGVQGDYSEPQYVEAAPTTERMPSGFPGQATEEATPLSLLAGNKLAMDVTESAPKSADAIQSKEIVSALTGTGSGGPKGFPAKERIQLTEVRKSLGNMSREQQDELLKQMQRDGELVLYRNDNPRELTKADKDAAMDVGGSPRHLVYFTPKNTPSPKEPSHGPAIESQAMEGALSRVNEVDKRLGPLPPADKEKMLLDLLSKKLGRTVTREDLVKAGIVSGGVATAFSDDENVQSVGAATLFGRGKRGKPRKSPPGGPSAILDPPRKPPTQPEAKLDDGTVVKGWGAVRRGQHTDQEALEMAKRRIGVEGDSTTMDRIIQYNSGNKLKIDTALWEEAKKLGREEELLQAAAAASYGELSDMAWGRGGRGYLTAAGLHLDPIAEVLSGAERNPFAKGPDGNMRMMARELLNLSGGRVGARYGNDAERLIRDKQEEKKRPVKNQQEEQRKNQSNATR
jgi:hypothetical protein